MATPVVTAAQKWEYKIVQADCPLGMEQAIEMRLNLLGEEGWEMVAVKNDFALCYFKRPTSS